MFDAVLQYIVDEGPRTCLREIHFTNFDEPTTKLFEEEGQKHKQRLAAGGTAVERVPSAAPVMDMDYMIRTFFSFAAKVD